MSKPVESISIAGKRITIEDLLTAAKSAATITNDSPVTSEVILALLKVIENQQNEIVYLSQIVEDEWGFKP